MYTVLLYGEEKDPQVTNTLLSSVRASGRSALHITSKAVSIIPPLAKSPDYLILDGFAFENLHVGRGIVIFRQKILRRQNCTIPNGFCAIVDPANTDAVQALIENCMQTVTCGLSRKDTVTFSSMGSGEAVVSLQRKLKNMDGEMVEPCELPVRFAPGHTEYALLASSVALMLCTGCPEKDFFIQ